MYTYECLAKAELEAEVFQDSYLPALKMVEPPSQAPYFQGFHYFAPHHLTEFNLSKNPEPRFLVAREEGVEAPPKPHNIVGVLKLGHYGLAFLKQDGSEDKDRVFPYLAVNYIDVREDHKRKGIATSLIRFLNQVLNPTDFLLGTFLSEEGRSARLDEIIKREFSACRYFDEQYDLCEYLTRPASALRQ